MSEATTSGVPSPSLCRKVRLVTAAVEAFASIVRVVYGVYVVDRVKGYVRGVRMSMSTI
jgi:hypothetical protein